MKIRTSYLALIGVLLLVLGGAGATAALGWRSGGPLAGDELNGGDGGMMKSGMPFGGMLAGPGMPPGGLLDAGGATTGQPLTLDQAQQAAQAALDRLGARDVVIAEMLEFEDNFYALVAERRTGSGAFALLVRKTSGAVVPEYGPNMLWNTRYDPLAGPRDLPPMTVSADRATQLATAWLARHQPGTRPAAPARFPGYYTLDILTEGRVTGMLSVNGYTGQIWYHTWHGASTPR